MKQYWKEIWKVMKMPAKKNHFKLMVILGLLNLILNPAFSQDKLKIRLDLSYHQSNNELPSLNVLIRTRIDRRYEPVEGIKVYFYFNEASNENLLGSAISVTDGNANLSLAESFKSIWDSTNVFIFFATVVDDPKYEDADDEIEIAKANMEMKLIEDEGKKVKIVVQKFGTDGLEPASEVYVRLEVKRTFSSLRIGDDSYETDEDGEVIIDFPEDIPGGLNGELGLVAKVDDNDELGNLQIDQTVKWGIIVSSSEDFFSERTLWARRDRAPVWLLVFPNLIILGIWGTIIYLILQIFRIKKVGRI